MRLATLLVVAFSGPCLASPLTRVRGGAASLRGSGAGLFGGRSSSCLRRRQMEKLRGQLGASGFPSGYGDVVRRAADSVTQMLRDGKKFIEIEFPVTGLSAVPGDGEGANEMTASAVYTQEIVKALERNGQVTRVFFPDEKEAQRQKKLFKNIKNVRVDFLCRPSPLADIGLDPNKVRMKDRIRDDDELYVIAYPSFDPREMIQVRELSDDDTQKRPIVVINGELDRIRSGYYPGLFYPRLMSAMNGFIDKFDQALYLHNFKGRTGGALLRMYPGQYQVFTREQFGRQEVKRVYEQETMPTLKEVSLEILPKYS
mmetsp:Transcript_11475/g.22022  ORF Transcript_11475/g.22022 Transcript_11475/m.22022 type:complete len:314 (-) Transcript_11475:118-1059(-)